MPTPNYGSTNEVTPSSLRESVEYLLSEVDLDGNRKPMMSPMIWGAPGIGKTESIRQIADAWGCRLVAIHLPQYDPTDLKGIPVRLDNGDVKWQPSSYLPKMVASPLSNSGFNCDLSDFRYADKYQIGVIVSDERGNEVAWMNIKTRKENMGHFEYEAGTNPLRFTNSGSTISFSLPANNKEKYTITFVENAILFLDELTAANPDIQNAALQLVLDKRVAEYDLPPCVPIIAAGNRDSDNAHIYSMSAPLANRFFHLSLIPSVDDFRDWAVAKRVRTDIISYIMWKGSSALFKFTPEAMGEGDAGFPSPRSWALLSNQLHDKLPDHIQNTYICAAIGNSSAQSFMSYRNETSKLPSTDDILQGKEVKFKTTGDGVNAGIMYGMAMGLVYKLKDYYDTYYDNDFDAESQCDEWKVAASSFCLFLEKHMSEEITTYVFHMWALHFKTSTVCFIGLVEDAFFKKYQPFIMKTV